MVQEYISERLHPTASSQLYPDDKIIQMRMVVLKLIPPTLNQITSWHVSCQIVRQILEIFPFTTHYKSWG